MCGGVSHAHMHAHTCTHTCTCMLNMINMLNMDASMLAAICNFYTCIHVRACMCVHACACMHMCVHACGDTTHASKMPQTPPTHLPPPQSHREPKTPKFSKSSTNQDNLILFEDSLPLNTIDYSCSPWIPPTHLPHPPELRKPKLEELQ